MIKGDEMNRSEKLLKVTKSDVLRLYTPSQTFLNDFACMFKEIFRFFEIFRISLKAASNFISVEYQVIFSKVRSVRLQNSNGHILLCLTYYARVVQENYELTTLTSSKNSNFSVASTQALLMTPLSRQDERLLLSYRQETFSPPLRGF